MTGRTTRIRRALRNPRARDWRPFRPHLSTPCTCRYLHWDFKRHDSCSKLSCKFLEAAREAGLWELLRIPILLLMLCLLYKEKNILPERKTDIIWEMNKLIVQWSARKTGLILSEEELKSLLSQLGQLSWEALRRDTQQLLIPKVKTKEIVFAHYCCVSQSSSHPLSSF